MRCRCLLLPRDRAADAKLGNHGESLLKLIREFLEEKSIVLKGEFPWEDQKQEVRKRALEAAASGEMPADSLNMSPDDMLVSGASASMVLSASNGGMCKILLCTLASRPGQRWAFGRSRVESIKAQPR